MKEERERAPRETTLHLDLVFSPAGSSIRTDLPAHRGQSPARSLAAVPGMGQCNRCEIFT